MFIEKKLLSEGQLTDPDFRLNEFIKNFNLKDNLISCSKCHHCR